MTRTRGPFSQSYWVTNWLCAGAYPGSADPVQHAAKGLSLVDAGVVRVINLMEGGEVNANGQPFEPYAPVMARAAAERGVTIEHLSLPIRDAHAPTAGRMREILAVLDESERRSLITFIHCWGGHGRTSTVVACALISRGETPDAAIERIHDLRSGLPKHHHPFEADQEHFIRQWPCPR